MEHLVYYDIAAAFVVLTALVAYHLRKYSENFQSRVYRVMLYALLVVSTSDFYCSGRKLLSEKQELQSCSISVF